MTLKYKWTSKVKMMRGKKNKNKNEFEKKLKSHVMLTHGLLILKLDLSF